MDHHNNHSSSYPSYYGNGQAGGGGGSSGNTGYYSRDHNNNTNNPANNNHHHYHSNYYSNNGNGSNTNLNYSLHHAPPSSSGLQRSTSSSYYNDSEHLNYHKPISSSWDRGVGTGGSGGGGSNDYYHEPPSRYSKSYNSDPYYPSDPYYSNKRSSEPGGYAPSSSGYADNGRKYDYPYLSLPSSSSYGATPNDRYYDSFPGSLPPSSASYSDPYPSSSLSHNYSDGYFRSGGYFNNNAVPLSSYESRFESSNNRYISNDQGPGYEVDRRWASKLDSSRASRWSKFDSYNGSVGNNSSHLLPGANAASAAGSLSDSPSKKSFSWSKQRDNNSHKLPLSPFKTNKARGSNTTPSKSTTIVKDQNESKEVSGSKKKPSGVPMEKENNNAVKEEITAMESDEKPQVIEEESIKEEEKPVDKIQDPAIEMFVRNSVHLFDYRLSLSLLPLNISLMTLKAHLPPEPEPEPVKAESKDTTIKPSVSSTSQPSMQIAAQPVTNESKGEDSSNKSNTLPQKRLSETGQSEQQQQKKKLKSNDQETSNEPPKQPQQITNTPKTVLAPSSMNGKTEEELSHSSQPSRPSSSSVLQSTGSATARGAVGPSSTVLNHPVTPQVSKSNSNNSLPPSIQKPNQPSLSRASSINTPGTISNTPATSSNKKPNTPYNNNDQTTPHTGGYNPSSESRKRDSLPPSSSSKPKTPHNPNTNAQTPHYYGGALPASFVAYDGAPDRRGGGIVDDWNRSGGGDYRGGDRRYDASGPPIGPPLSASKYPESNHTDLRRSVSGEWRDDRYRYDYDNAYPPPAGNSGSGGYYGKYDPKYDYGKYDGDPYSRGGVGGVRGGSRDDQPYYPPDLTIPPSQSYPPADPAYPNRGWDSGSRGWNESSDRGKPQYEYSGRGGGGGGGGGSYPPTNGPPPSGPRRDDYYDPKYYDRKGYY